jgi:uncharacterized protein YjiS (DUF1127 family)
MHRPRTTEHTSNRAAASLLERVRRHARQSLVRWLARRTAVTLASLGDEMLKDIGIARAQIPAIALQVAAGGQFPPADKRLASQPTQKECAL